MSSAKRLFLVLVLLLSACSSKDKGPEEMIEAVDAPEAELYLEALDAYQDGFYSLSREKFQTLLFGYPASPAAELATLKIAETYLYNRLYSEAVQSFQQFISKFPTSKYNAYARFRMGDSELARYSGIKRDQFPLTKAAEHYKKLSGDDHFLISRELVNKRLGLIANLLVKHERSIIKFYNKQGLSEAAEQREKRLSTALASKSSIEVIDELGPAT